MKRGFDTIATGRKHYYELAANLLQSYRFFSPNPYPFAIIAEEENEFTAPFDDVILINDSTHSFMDKLLLLKYCPYDETVFIDADCLAYGDLNEYWDVFANSTDFSAIGINVPLDQQVGAWYNVEDIGEYGKRITYKSRVHTGVCFIRRSETLNQLYEDSMDINAHFHELVFHTCPDAREECILGISMPMNNMKAVKAGDHRLVTYPLASFLNAKILNGTLQYKTSWHGLVEKGLLLHWGTAQTYLPTYEFEAACLHFIVRKVGKKLNVAEKLWFEKRMLYGCLILKSLHRRFWRHFRREFRKLFRRHR